MQVGEDGERWGRLIGWGLGLRVEGWGFIVPGSGFQGRVRYACPHGHAQKTCPQQGCIFRGGGWVKGSEDEKAPFSLVVVVVDLILQHSEAAAYPHVVLVRRHVDAGSPPSETRWEATGQRCPTRCNDRTRWGGCSQLDRGRVVIALVLEDEAQGQE